MAPIIIEEEQNPFAPPVYEAKGPSASDIYQNQDVRYDAPIYERGFKIGKLNNSFDTGGIDERFLKELMLARYDRNFNV